MSMGLETHTTAGQETGATDSRNHRGGSVVNSGMTYLRLMAIAIFAAAASGFGQNSGICATPLSWPAKAGMTLTVESRSGEVDFAGSDQEGIRVSCKTGDEDRSGEVHVSFERTGDFAKLRVSGGPDSNFHIRIEVPRRTNLRVHVSAGELRVDDVTGDKELSLNAGEIRVSGVNASEYRSVNASVGVGGLSASSFGVGKCGFFRSFDKESLSGAYRLHAHLLTGNIQLD